MRRRPPEKELVRRAKEFVFGEWLGTMYGITIYDYYAKAHQSRHHAMEELLADHGMKVQVQDNRILINLKL